MNSEKKQGVIVDTRLDSYFAVRRKLGRLYGEVLGEIDKSNDGLAAFEIAEHLAKVTLNCPNCGHKTPIWNRQDVAPRCTELAEMGYLRTTGAMRTNPASGKLCDVYARP